jgi:hypothetical protein
VRFGRLAAGGEREGHHALDPVPEKENHSPWYSQNYSNH